MPALLRKYKKALHALLLALFLGGAASWTFAKEPVVIAVAGPMTGDSVSVGVQYNAGVSAALAVETNGSLLGRPLQVTTHDDQCNASIAEKVALSLIKDRQPNLVIGHSCSSATLITSPLYAANAILQITPASTHPQITERGISTLFRMIGRDDMQGQLAAERLAAHHGDQRLAVVHSPNSYSKGLATAAIRELQKQGLAPDLILEVPRGADSYLQPIQTLMAADIDVLYLVGGALDNGIFMRQLRLMGSSIQVLGSDTLVSATFYEVAGSAAEGLSFLFTPEITALPTSLPALKAIQAMGIEPAGYTLLAYAATEIWIEGVKRANSFAAEAVAAALREAPIDCILGSVSFDAKGDIKTPYQPFVWYQWQAGERVILE